MKFTIASPQIFVEWLLGVRSGVKNLLKKKKLVDWKEPMSTMNKFLGLFQKGIAWSKLLLRSVGER